ncbi:MAG: hypothetical protein KDE27_30955, partial [Planctomycetes bacterium]|nr:hypothetical protein [Planctomycetota bacterium]
MIQRCALFVMLGAFLAFGIAWQLLVDGTELQGFTDSVRQRQLGSPRTIDALMRLGLMTATPDAAVLAEE